MMRALIIVLIATAACDDRTSAGTDALPLDGMQSGCGNGLEEPNLILDGPFGPDRETCDDGVLNGTRESLCSTYCGTQEIDLRVSATIEMPLSATDLFPTRGLIWLAPGLDVVTTRWDETGLQVLFGVDQPTRRAPIQLHQVTRPTGVALAQYGTGATKLYWIEAYSEELGETRMYEADLGGETPVISTMPYPFPAAAGGQLYGQGSFALVDLSRDDPPHLLTATFDPARREWTDAVDLGPAPGSQLRFTASWGHVGLGGELGDPTLFWLLDEPASWAGLSWERPLPPVLTGLGLEDVVALDMGFFTRAREPRNDLPLILTTSNDLWIWDPVRPAGEPGALRFFAHVPADARRLVTVDINSNGFSDAVVLGTDGTLTVLMNNDEGSALKPQTFPLLDPCTDCALTFVDYPLASSDNTLIVFEPHRVSGP